jgi:3-dehydroquinate synthase
MQSCSAGGAEMEKLLRGEQGAGGNCTMLRDQGWWSAQDETEELRAILNFGHTIGHALEAISHYGKYLHGEAISIGQVAAAKLSGEILGLPEKDVERIRSLFDRAGLPTNIALNQSQRKKRVGAMKLDKKVSAGEIKFVLARRIGEVEFGQKVPMTCIEQILSPSIKHNASRVSSDVRS